MEDDPQFRKKLSEREISSLSESEVQKIERVNKAIEDMELAEAKKESQQKLRILFERAPQETLPFLVYCIYVAAAGLSSFIYLISKFEGNTLYILLVFLLIILILPIIILPKIYVRKFFSWILKLKRSKK
jgi:hypothetical protein